VRKCNTYEPRHEIPRARGGEKRAQLTLEWVHEPDGSRALVFDRATWAACEEVAAAKSQTASQMIATAVAACFGKIHADNCTPFLGNPHLTASRR
jgi:hypothetical protein